RPTLICCKTMIGWGSPNLAGQASTHGAALGEKEVAASRTHLNWPHIPFIVPEEIYASWNAKKKGEALEQAWQDLFSRYQDQYPELAKELLRRIEGRLPSNWPAETAKLLDTLNRDKQSVATRKASQLCLDHYAPLLPEIMG